MRIKVRIRFHRAEGDEDILEEFCQPILDILCRTSLKDSLEASLPIQKVVTATAKSIEKEVEEEFFIREIVLQIIGSWGYPPDLGDEILSNYDFSALTTPVSEVTNGLFSNISFEQNEDYEFPTSPNGTHPTFYDYPEDERPFVVALESEMGMTEGELYRVHRYNTDTSGGANEDIGDVRIYSLDGLTIYGYNDRRGDWWEIVDRFPTDWEKSDGDFDQDKLDSGIVKGLDGSVSVDQNFSSSLPVGTLLKVIVTRTDSETAVTNFEHLKADGGVQGSPIMVYKGLEAVEYSVETEAMTGIRYSTENVDHEATAIEVTSGINVPTGWVLPNELFSISSMQSGKLKRDGTETAVLEQSVTLEPNKEYQVKVVSNAYNFTINFDNAVTWKDNGVGSKAGEVSGWNTWQNGEAFITTGALTPTKIQVKLSNDNVEVSSVSLKKLT
jgi:hypothetical protein